MKQEPTNAMHTTFKNTFLAMLIALALVVTGSPSWAGEAPKNKAPAKAETPAAAKADKGDGTDWQARLAVKVLEWAGQTNLDYGFSLAYYRDPDNDSSIVGPFNDGRGNPNNPPAYLTFPSQAASDLGLRVFLDQMDAKNGGLEAVVEALERQGDVKMLAEPTLTLKKGGSNATVKTGTRVPYASEQVAGATVVTTTLFMDTGVVLTVGFKDVAELNGDTFAQFDVTADVTSLAGFVTVAVDKDGNPLEAPQTNSRHIKSNVLVRDNTTLIAGILKEDAEQSNRQGPPIISDLPVIKYLFPNRSSVTKTHEILFLFNVDLIRPGAV